ncbi:MAG: BON domain-containing protein [Pirellulaceae bacterium]|jgi:hypothetical protein|nr:BON domain-containing protein [Pirellulaceae bacterium]MDP7017019.1 BON domain-containing protein [Pirellulaceae bacterium]
MRRQVITASAIVILTATSASAQFTAGTSQENAVQGSGLSNRFQTTFDRFQTGSSDGSATVGATAASVPGVLNSANNAAGGFGGGFGGFGGGFGRGGFGGGFGRGGFGQNQQQQNQQQYIRTKVVLGFTPKLTGSPIVASRLNTRFARLSHHITAEQPINVTMEGRVAVITGIVSSEREKDLLEQLAQFEPGVDQVRNEIQIAASESLPAPPDLPPRP